MLTTNFSLPFVPGTVTVSFFDAQTELGEMPRWSAVASTNGLNAEPGWRWPCVARLNGCDAKFVAADHRPHLAGGVVDRDERRLRARRARSATR